MAIDEKTQKKIDAASKKFAKQGHKVAITAVKEVIDETSASAKEDGNKELVKALREVNKAIKAAAKEKIDELVDSIESPLPADED